MAPPAVTEVELHPLVLLSVVDHYYRVVSWCSSVGREAGEPCLSPSTPSLSVRRRHRR